MMFTKTIKSVSTDTPSEKKGKTAALAVTVILSIAVCLSSTITTLAKSHQAKKILIINSYHPAYDWTDLEMDGIETALKQYGGIIEQDVEYLDTKHFSDTKHYENLYALFKNKAGRKQYDVIITTDDNALVFLLRHHDELYPNVPVVFCGVNHFDKPPVKSLIKDCDYVTGVTEGTITLKTLEIALELHPAARQVVVLLNDKKWWDRKKKIINQKLGKRAKLIRHFLWEPEKEDLISTIEGLGSESIVLFTGPFHPDGRLVSFKNPKDIIEKHCAAPIYSLTQRWFKYGAVVGGMFNNAFLQGQYAGEMAVSILNGANVQDIAIRLEPTRRYMFDRSQLKRFKIAIPKLPKGSIIVNKPQSFYYVYKTRIWITITVISVLTGTVILLSVNNIIRRSAEQKLLEYQSKLKSLASEISITEEKERRRIAKELHNRISQSLVISKVKLDTISQSASSSRLSESLNEICDSLDETISSTKTLTFDLSYPLLHELGFEVAVENWLAEYVEQKHGIVSQFEDDGQTKPLDEDVCALLFRNIQELLINVIKHANAHKVEVSSLKDNGFIKVRIKDDGVGFDVSEVTSTPTRTGGFGLFSIRERLEQLGGQLEIESKPGNGTTVTVTAPLKRKV